MAGFRTRGHRAALEFVARSTVCGRPPHSLLLVGPEGVGKSTLAADLAAGLLCIHPDVASRPCRQCRACRKLEHGNHPDLHLLAPEGAGGQIKVGQVQALSADLALLPLEGAFRVAIVEHADRLNQDAQNALLKTLEEPPSRVCLILAADDGVALLPTVESRCARLRLGPVAPDVIAAMLVDAGSADAAAAAGLARLAAGRPGVALALAGSPDAALAQGRLSRTLLDLVVADTRTRLGSAGELLADGALLAAAMTGAAEGERVSTRRASAAERRASPAERRAAVAALIGVWSDVARDLAVASRGGAREIRQSDLLDDLLGRSRTVDARAVAEFVGRLDGTARAVDSYANPELALDSLLLRWSHVQNGVPNAS